MADFQDLLRAGSSIYDGGVQAPAIDLTVGDQNGYLLKPNLWPAMANYVQQPVRAVVIDFPMAMDYMVNSEYHKAALKSLIEVQHLEISGLNSACEWEFEGPVVGNAGEKFESFTKATRAVSAPKFKWAEKEGMAIAKFWHNLNMNIIADPDTQLARVISLPSYIQAGSPTLLPSDQSFITLFYEADKTLTRVVKAWLCCNMQAKTAGEWDGRKVTGGSGELKEVEIEFTSWTLACEAVNALAQDYLNSLKLTDLRAQSHKPFASAIAPDVKATAVGLAKSLTESVTS